ncbi:unnamed protein product [Rhizoctonia solani]|uniref:Fungal-type protein kinase domain-containing protein n=1 Tax=Rhizoctonia solani TaxID=456999 RepID=A0A8H3H9K3_9AGAM|nr:unnamed protein product [Rhizoctonia solani]
MDYPLEDEMRGEIFCDPKFIENFLSIGKEWQPLLETEFDRLPGNIQHALDESITAERDLYEPTLDVLRSIKDAVDTVRKAHSLGALGTNFCDSHATVIPDDPPDTRLKPDLILFESDEPDQRHWETLMMPIEVKAKHTYRKVGMKKLAQYARSVFAHQIHRRHLYGMVLCKWAATFVRFDRSGIVHSEPIDMFHSPKEFRRAFAGLMMMDRDAFGYDTAFTVEYTPGGRLEYYIDLPAAAFPSDGTEFDAELATSTSDLVVGAGLDSSHDSRTLQQYPTRKFKVIERLHHHGDLRGRATIVLRLREVQSRTGHPEPGEGTSGLMARSCTRSNQGGPKWEEVPGAREYVLKLMWRDPGKPQEGDILKRLVGEYGVVQCQWYSDVLRWGATCHGPEATSCDICRDVTPAQTVVRQVRNLGDLDIEVEPEKDEDEPKYIEVDTVDCIGGFYTHRMTRIYTWALFTTVSRPLWAAESPRQFLEAVLDAMLGYWQTFNNGILHRDISDGNVMIVEPGQGYNLCKWNSEWGSTNGQAIIEAQNHRLAESRRLARETVVQLGRYPIGFLGDYDLAITHRGMESAISGHACKESGELYSQMPDAKSAIVVEPRKLEELKSSPVAAPGHKSYGPIDFRTGTPPFMSIRVLRVKLGTPHDHHFMDDLESFFWLILRCFVEHIDPSSDEDEGGNKPTKKAMELLHQLDRPVSELVTLAKAKSSFLVDCNNGGGGEPTMVDELKACENSWANNPAVVYVIVNMGIHFH